MELRDTSGDHGASSHVESGVVAGAIVANGYRTDPTILAAIPMTVDMVENAAVMVWPPYDEIIYSSPIDQIYTMAETMQFKRGADKDGVSPHMRNVGVAEVAFGKAGFVWRNLKKKKYVTDGHQRLGMFKRVKVSNQGNPLNFHYFRMDEANGWTPQKAMLFAAYANIAEDGPTTKPLDVARLFRTQPDPIDLAFLRKYLPARNRCLEQGLWLSRLGTEAFDMMENHPSAQASWGVMVAQRIQISGDEQEREKAAEMQAVLLETLIEAKPTSDLETSQLISMAILAGFTKVEQTDMFGKISVRETLIPQRFKVYREVDSLIKKRLTALKTVRGDRKTRATLKVGAEQQAIQTAADNLTWAYVLLKKEANVVGDVSDDLKGFARKLKDKDISVADAAEQMLARLETHVEKFRIREPDAAAKEEARIAAAKAKGVDAAGDVMVTRDLLTGVRHENTEQRAMDI